MVVNQHVIALNLSRIFVIGLLPLFFRPISSFVFKLASYIDHTNMKGFVVIVRAFNLGIVDILQT